MYKWLLSDLVEYEIWMSATIKQDFQVSYVFFLSYNFYKVQLLIKHILDLLYYKKLVKHVQTIVADFLYNMVIIKNSSKIPISLI